MLHNKLSHNLATYRNELELSVSRVKKSGYGLVGMPNSGSSGYTVSAGMGVGWGTAVSSKLAKEKMCF